jgi:hypothetical protein
MRSSRVSALLSALLLLGAAVATQVLAQSPPCDQSLRPAKDSRYAYGPRGDRCEGLYVKDVGGTTLTIMSLTAAFDKYDPAADPILHLAWSAPAGDSLRIQVRAIQPNIFFGMDAERPLAAKTYDWSTAILSPLNILQDEIGLLAWTRVKRDARTLTVHVPVSVTRSKKGAPSTGYSLVLYPVKELKEVYLTLGPADSTGQPETGALIKDHEPQEQGYYPAERPIRLSLPPLRPPGLYYLEVTATLRNGKPAKADPMLIEASGQ